MGKFLASCLKDICNELLFPFVLGEVKKLQAYEGDRRPLHDFVMSYGQRGIQLQIQSIPQLLLTAILYNHLLYDLVVPTAKTSRAFFTTVLRVPYRIYDLRGSRLLAHGIGCCPKERLGLAPVNKLIIGSMK